MLSTPEALGAVMPPAEARGSSDRARIAAGGPTCPACRTELDAPGAICAFCARTAISGPSQWRETLLHWLVMIGLMTVIFGTGSLLAPRGAAAGGASRRRRQPVPYPVSGSIAVRVVHLVFGHLGVAEARELEVSSIQLPSLMAMLVELFRSCPPYFTKGANGMRSRCAAFATRSSTAARKCGEALCASQPAASSYSS